MLVDLISMPDTIVKIKVGDRKCEDLVLHSALQGPIKNLTLLRRSLLLAELSLISYLPADEAAKASARLGFTDSMFFDRDGAQAFWLCSETDSVVACRGTEAHEWNDIKADADAVTAVAETVGRVHRGFKREVDDLWPRLEEALTKNRKPLWFTGHSLGGAMATICAGRCKLSFIKSNPEELYSFGSPRVGNRRYVHFAKITHYRWVNNNDIVATVPPRWCGYQHSGTEMYLNHVGRLKKLSRMGKFWDGMRGFWSSLRKGRIDQLSDHSMFDYIKAIHALCLEEEGVSKAEIDAVRSAAPGPHAFSDLGNAVNFPNRNQAINPQSS